MKIKSYSEFSINESFGLSPELYDFIRKNSIDWKDFTDSLIDLNDIKNLTINNTCHVVDEKGHIVNIDLDEKSNYSFNYDIRISYYVDKRGKLEQFYKTQENLNTISICLQEMIDRVSDKTKLISNEFKIDYVESYKSVKYYFELQFRSDITNVDELKKSFDNYKKTTHHTPEFNKGISELVKYYEERGINLLEHLDTADGPNCIMVGVITDDDIYGIGEYDTQTKRFTIDWGEVDSSIDYLNEID